MPQQEMIRKLRARAAMGDDTLARLRAKAESDKFGPVGSVLASMEQGATFNWGDELYGIVDPEGAEAYRAKLRNIPMSIRLPGEIAGGLLWGGGAGSLGKLALIGATQGAAAGAGAAEGGLENRVLGGVLGGAVGGAANPALNALARAVRPMIPRMAPDQQTHLEHMARTAAPYTEDPGLEALARKDYRAQQQAQQAAQPPPEPEMTAGPPPFVDAATDPRLAGTQVVDREGRPRLMYRGEKGPRPEFYDAEGPGKNDAGWLGRGIHFYGGEEDAMQYGTPHAYYIRAQEPYVLSPDEHDWLMNANDPDVSRAFTENLKSEGYDSVYWPDDMRDEWMVFSPDQIVDAATGRTMARTATTPAGAGTGTPAEELIPLDKLHLNPDEFQFKKTVDPKTGRTEQMKDVKRFVSASSGKLLLYRQANGRLDVVNGHQRVNLARKVGGKDDAGRPIKFAADIIDHTEMTPQQAKIEGAKINLREGTGDAVDAATIFREMTDDQIAELLEALPMAGKAVVRDGMGLSKLTREAFDAFKDNYYNAPMSEKIRPSVAAQLGELIPSGVGAAADLLQRALVRHWAKNPPADLTAGKMDVLTAISQSQRMGVERTANLFGTEELAALALKERQAIAKAAHSIARESQQVFSTLADKVRVAGQVEGNIINVEGSQDAAQQAAVAQMLLDRYIGFAGPVSRQMDELAAKVKDGTLTEKEAGQQIIDAIVRQFDADQAAGRAAPDPTEALLRATSGMEGAGRAAEPPPEAPRATPDEPPPVDPAEEAFVAQRRAEARAAHKAKSDERQTGLAALAQQVRDVAPVPAMGEGLRGAFARIAARSSKLGKTRTIKQVNDYAEEVAKREKKANAAALRQMGLPASGGKMLTRARAIRDDYGLAGLYNIIKRMGVDEQNIARKADITELISRLEGEPQAQAIQMLKLLRAEAAHNAAVSAGGGTKSHNKNLRLAFEPFLEYPAMRRVWEHSRRRAAFYAELNRQKERALEMTKGGIKQVVSEVAAATGIPGIALSALMYTGLSGAPAIAAGAATAEAGRRALGRLGTSEGLRRHLAGGGMQSLPAGLLPRLGAATSRGLASEAGRP